MADIQITCIHKEPLQNPHTGITHVGTIDQRWTRQEIINTIDSGHATFYTVVDGRRAEVRIYDGPFSRYLRTYADGRWNDDLLGLTECPR